MEDIRRIIKKEEIEMKKGKIQIEEEVGNLNKKEVKRLVNVSMRKIERRKEGIRGNGGKLECNI